LFAKAFIFAILSSSVENWFSSKKSLCFNMSALALFTCGKRLLINKSVLFVAKIELIAKNINKKYTIV
jgi:hypothetical protein